MNIEVTSSRIVYQNKWMSLREDQLRRADGSPGVYAVVEKPDFATVVAYEDGGFWLVQQDRYPTGKRTWEFPQGTFDSDDPQTVARAELAQETGITAGSMRFIATVYNAPGLTSQACHIFLATDLTHGHPDLDAEEQDLTHKWFSTSHVEQMILHGETIETVSLAAYLLLKVDHAL